MNIFKKAFTIQGGAIEFSAPLLKILLPHHVECRHLLYTFIKEYACGQI